MFSLKKFIDFALGGRTAVDGLRIGLFGLTDKGASFADSFLCVL